MIILFSTSYPSGFIDGMKCILVLSTNFFVSGLVLQFLPRSSISFRSNSRPVDQRCGIDLVIKTSIKEIQGHSFNVFCYHPFGPLYSQEQLIYISYIELKTQNFRTYIRKDLKSHRGLKSYRLKINLTVTVQVLNFVQSYLRADMCLLNV